MWQIFNIQLSQQVVHIEESSIIIRFLFHYSSRLQQALENKSTTSLITTITVIIYLEISVFSIILGTEFLCNVILAPVRNETSTVIMYILNFEDLTDKNEEERHNHGKYQVAVDFKLLIYLFLP